MKSETQNSTVIEQNAEQPLPPPPQFDESMIAAAQPVEPLSTNQSAQRRQPMMQFLKGRWGLLGALLIVALLSGVLYGMVSAEMVSGTHEEFTQPLAAEPPSGATMANQSVEAAPKASIATPSVKSSINVRDHIRPRYSRPAEVVLTKSDLPQQSDRPVARKVGEIYFGHRKESRRREVSRRRDDNDDR